MKKVIVGVGLLISTLSASIVYAVPAGWQPVTLSCVKTSGIYPLAGIEVAAYYDTQTGGVGGTDGHRDSYGYTQEFLRSSAANIVFVNKFKKVGRFFESSIFRCSF